MSDTKWIDNDCFDEASWFRFLEAMEWYWDDQEYAPEFTPYGANEDGVIVDFGEHPYLPGPILIQPYIEEGSEG